MYNVTLLFTLGDLAIVLVRGGVEIGGQVSSRGLFPGLPGVTPLPVGHPPLPIAQPVKCLLKSPGRFSFTALLFLIYLQCHAEPQRVPSAPSGLSGKSKWSPRSGATEPDLAETMETQGQSFRGRKSSHSQELDFCLKKGCKSLAHHCSLKAWAC